MLIEAIRRFHAGDAGEAQVVDALRDSRLLIPLIAHAGELGHTDAGRRVDKTQELAIVTVLGPDGRTVLPAFTSVAAMSRWNPAARPIPAAAPRVALAAASERTELVIVDPTSETEFGIRRPALAALAQLTPWMPSYLDDAVMRAFMDAVATEPDVIAVRLAPADPDARLTAPELLVQLTLRPGLDQTALDALLARLQSRCAASETIATRVDSMTLRVVSA